MTRTVRDPEKLLALGIIAQAARDWRRSWRPEVDDFLFSNACQELCDFCDQDYDAVLAALDQEDCQQWADWREVREMRFAAERGVG